MGCMFYKIVFLFVLIFVSGVASADWRGKFSVGTIEVASTNIFISPPEGTSQFTFPTECTNKSWVVFSGTGESGGVGDRALSVALSAQVTGKKVKYLISGCTGSYIKATAIQIFP